MSEKKRVRQTFKKMLDVPRWMDLERVGQGAGYIFSAIGRLFKVKHATRKESFEQAVTRLHLSDKDLNTRCKEFKKLYRIFFVFFLAIFAYAIYLFVNGSFVAGLLAFVVSLLAATYAFRYHFWYFQTSRRQLGMTIKQWFYEGLLKDSRQKKQGKK